MVEGLRRLPMRPCSVSTRAPKACRQPRAVFSERWPARLAEVDTMAWPSAWHSAAASPWAVMRTAILSWRPRSSAGTRGAAGSRKVYGPGQ
ncbi:hypothetical protein D3C78_1839500 [compost metagenome]